MATSLLDLPDELIITILDHLDVHELVRLFPSVSCTCRRLHQLSNAENFWKKFCAEYWLDEQREYSKESWKKNFFEWHKKLGRYMGCYARVKSAWRRIEDALEERSPQTKQLLKGPVDEMAIEAVNEISATPLPPEVACSYLIHNGQQVIPGAGSLLGNLEVYDHHSMEVFVPLEFNIKNEFPRKGFIAVSWCPYVNYGQALALQDLPGVKAGSAYYLNDIGDPRSRRRRAQGYFILASSFLEWLENLADRLADPHLIVQSSKILQFYHEPSCVAVTRDVKVTVATAFVPRLSQITVHKTRTLFAYRISITMDKDAPQSSTCKLQTRHWEITDSTGEYHEVNGNAVIGLYPLIKPGSDFSYCSWTPFNSEGGFMQGHFNFVNLQSGDKYDVICPRFNMKCPPISLAPAEGPGAGGDEWVDEEDDDDDYEEEDSEDD